MHLYHDSRSLSYRNPFGAVPVGGDITISLDVEGFPAGKVYLRLWQQKELLIPMEPVSPSRYAVTITAPEIPGLLWYYFALVSEKETIYFGHLPDRLSSLGEISAAPESWQITVYHPTVLPEWYKNAVMYQIFPDRFARGSDYLQRQADAAHPEGWKENRRLVVQKWDDTPFYCKDQLGRVIRWPFFGGTLQGIREKLDYLQSMGVGVLYLNPIFRAASNHKYDTANYLEIDPGFGDEKSFSDLCAAAREKGIRIILDGVFSHTGDDSVYFNRYGNYPAPGAYGPEESPYDSWYRFGKQYPSGYECWWGVDALPDVEENDPGYQEFICGETGVIRKWLRLGASGWRLDVADELPDGFIEKIRAAGKAEKEDALLLGEVWEDATCKISYGLLRKYLLGSELDCTMHYPFRVGALNFILGLHSAGHFAMEMDSIRENYPPTAFYGAMNLIGTHDTPRILTLLGEAPDPQEMSETEREFYTLPAPQRRMAMDRLKLMDIMMFGFPGVPCIYYGDEAGMEGYADPFNRGPFPWGREDTELQAFVRKLSLLRKEYPILVDGTFQPFAPCEDVFAWERRQDHQRLLCFVNRSETATDVFLPLSGKDLLTGDAIDEGEYTLSPMSALMLYHA